tara:strand:- start:2906 stop:3136 length:231 start_codon:yes stop_codon:yes gene_type:complete
MKKKSEKKSEKKVEKKLVEIIDKDSLASNIQRTVAIGGDLELIDEALIEGKLYGVILNRKGVRVRLSAENYNIIKE